MLFIFISSNHVQAYCSSDGWPDSFVSSSVYNHTDDLVPTMLEYTSSPNKNTYPRSSTSVLIANSPDHISYLQTSTAQVVINHIFASLSQSNYIPLMFPSKLKITTAFQDSLLPCSNSAFVWKLQVQQSELMTVLNHVNSSANLIWFSSILDTVLYHAKKSRGGPPEVCPDQSQFKGFLSSEKNESRIHKKVLTDRYLLGIQYPRQLHCHATLQSNSGEFILFQSLRSFLNLFDLITT